MLGPVWSSRRLSGSLSGSLLASVKSPFLRSSCRLTMGYCCSGCSSDARHLWRENSSVVTEGKYSSLGPERNHMCLVFNQPVWVLRSSRKAFSQMWSACFVSFGAEPRPALLTGVCRRHLATNKPPLFVQLGHGNTPALRRQPPSPDGAFQMSGGRAGLRNTDGTV